MVWEEEEGRRVTNERSGSRERGGGVGVKGSVKGKGTFYGWGGSSCRACEWGVIFKREDGREGKKKVGAA